MAGLDTDSLSLGKLHAAGGLVTISRVSAILVSFHDASPKCNLISSVPTDVKKLNVHQILVLLFFLWHCYSSKRYLKTDTAPIEMAWK